MCEVYRTIEEAEGGGADNEEVRRGVLNDPKGTPVEGDGDARSA